jgi:hypothetical protein
MKGRNLSSLNILTYQMIGEVDMFGSITDFVILTNFDGGLSFAKYSSIGNRYMKFFESIR